MIALAESFDRPAWLEARRHGVTATDVARLARGGANTWDAIRAEKAGLGRDFTTAAMQHGIDREPVILAYAQMMWGFEPCGQLLAAEDEPLFLATPDALNAVEVGEVKTTVHDWATLAEVPKRYVDQTLWQMRVTGRRRARIIFEPHDNGIPIYPEPRWFEVEWDPARVARLEAVAYEFLQSTGEPDADAAELDALLTVAADAKDAADAAAARYKAAQERIEEFLGGQPRRFSGSRASLTRSEDRIDRRFDSTRFKKAHPDLFADFQKVVAVKGALRITPVKEADE